jgi:hypothetical protein
MNRLWFKRRCHLWGIDAGHGRAVGLVRFLHLPLSVNDQHIPSAIAGELTGRGQEHDVGAPTPAVATTPGLAVPGGNVAGGTCEITERVMQCVDGQWRGGQRLPGAGNCVRICAAGRTRLPASPPRAKAT